MEAAILQFFASIRNPFLDVFFGLFSLLGEAMFVGGVAIVIFWLAPKKAGEQIIMTALTSFPLNSLVKFTVARPRPFTAGVVEYREPPFFADTLEPYASFPSGHTQSSSSVLFPAADTVPAKKRVLPFCVAAIAVLMVMLARLYFGAHYPTDVLAGLLFGAAVALFWALVFRFAYPYRHLILLAFAALSLVPCLFFLIPAAPDPAHDYVQAAGLLTGAAVALAGGEWLIRDRKTAFFRRLRRLPVGILVVAAVFLFTTFFPEGEGFSLLKWFLIALSAGLVAPVLFDLMDI